MVAIQGYLAEEDKGFSCHYVIILIIAYDNSAQLWNPEFSSCTPKIYRTDKVITKDLNKEDIIKAPQSGKNTLLDLINNKQFKIFLVVLIFIFSLMGRLYYVLDNPDMYANGLGPYGDTPLFHQLGYNLYAGNGFSGADNGAAYGMPLDEGEIKYEPVISRAPLYPFVISLVYKYLCDPKDMESIDTWHINWNKIRTVQCVLDAIVCLFVFFIVRTIYPASFWPAIISAGLQGVNLFSIYYTKAILRESVTTFFFVLAILLYIKALQKNNKYWWMLAGMGFGLGILGRAEYTLAILFLGGYIVLFNRKNFTDAFKKGLIFLVSVIIVVLPWTLRNVTVFDRLIVVSEPGVGNGLFYGLIDNWHGVGPFPDEVYEMYKDDIGREEMDALRKKQVRTMRSGTIENTENAEVFKEMALKQIRENPGKVFKIWITKLPRLWYQLYVQRNSIKEPSGNFIIFYFIFALYAFFSRGKEEKGLMAPILLLCIYLTAVSLPFSVTGRYSVPLIPGVISMTGIGLWLVAVQLKVLMFKRV